MASYNVRVENDEGARKTITVDAMDIEQAARLGSEQFGGGQVVWTVENEESQTSSEAPVNFPNPAAPEKADGSDEWRDVSTVEVDENAAGN